MVSNRKRKQPERGKATIRDYEAAKRLVEGGLSKSKACSSSSAAHGQRCTRLSVA